jgi:hypothetical protein
MRSSRLLLHCAICSFALAASASVRAEGVGIFVSESGDVLTAFNVVAGCRTPAIVTAEGRQKATIRATSKEADLALLRTPRPSPTFTRITLGSLGDLRKPVVIVRYFWFDDRGLPELVPARFRGSVTYAGGAWLFEVSSPIDDEDGGSPVIAENGEVVGIVVAKVRKRPNHVVAVDRTRVFGFLADAGVGLGEIPAELPEPPTPSPASAAASSGRGGDPVRTGGTSRPAAVPRNDAVRSVTPPPSAAGPPLLVGPAMPYPDSTGLNAQPSIETHEPARPARPHGGPDTATATGIFSDEELPDTPQTSARAFTFPVVCLDLKGPRKTR